MKIIRLEILNTPYSTFDYGVRQTTGVSFTSSKSSFTGCVRKQQPSSFSFSSFSKNTDCNTSSYEECIFTGTHITPTVSTTFKDCSFTNMHGTNDKGGAISCQESSLVIIISSCIFDGCSSVNCGGAVYVSGESNTLEVINSLFHSCITTNTDDSYPGGGGICMEKSSSSLTILSSTFISCKAQVSPRGGGAFFASRIKEAFTFSSRFVSCSTLNAGGAMFLWNLESKFSVCDSILKENSAGWGGGAIREHSNAQSDRVHLKFLFFTQNSAEADLGNDLLFRPEIFHSPCLHCLSARGNGIVIEDSSGIIQSIDGSNNWLPHART